MGNNKKIYFSDKPIDLADITPLEMEYPEKTFSPEPKTITMSVDCKMPKETADWFKEQMKELHEKEKVMLEAYGEIAKHNAEYYTPILSGLVTEESRKELLACIIQYALCKGWNDCFDYNMKHENKNI